MECLESGIVDSKDLKMKANLEFDLDYSSDAKTHNRLIFKKCVTVNFL